MRGALKITINWRALSIDRPTEVISRRSDGHTIVEMLRLLLVEFGKPIEEQLRSQPIINYRLSTNPITDFVNGADGTPYSSIRIDGTALYFCPQSDRSRKVRRLQSLFSRLRLPDGDDFPEESLTVTVDEE